MNARNLFFSAKLPPLPVVLLFLSLPLFSQIPVSQGEVTRTDFGGRNSIAGVIFLPTGSAANTRIRVRLSAPGSEVSAVTDEAGKFVISGLSNGSYTLQVEPDGDFESDPQRVDISTPRFSAGQVYTVTFRLRKKGGTSTKPGLVSAEFAGVPRRALEFYKKGLDRAAKGDHQGAVEQLLRAVSDYPDFLQAHSELGVQYQVLNDLEKAGEHLRSALRIKPDAYEPLANLGIVLVRQRKYGEAEPILRGALKLREPSPIVHFYLGRSMLGLKRPDEAETEFKTAYSQGGSEMIEARRALATIYLERGENKKALDEIEAYLAVNPSPPDEKHLRETVQQIKEYLKANPNH